jgi:hypothetical protein
MNRYFRKTGQTCPIKMPYMALWPVYFNEGYFKGLKLAGGFIRFERVV